MMNFTHNYWGQHDIINKIKILTKQGADTIYTAIMIKYHKYPSEKIIRHAIVWLK